jgi:phenylpyruvate tautomerase PptA (4-oxalocrotonate tautomerase family)
MPYLRIQTSQALDEVQNRDLLTVASRTVADALGKPERYVMVSLEASVPMVLGGEASPAAFVELKSIGLPESRTGELSSRICTMIESGLGIARDRIYIEFADVPRHLWGWNGATF